MSVVLRATAALLIVVLAALVVLVVAAPRLLESDAVRAEIVGALVAAVGHEVTVEALELQLAPLSVVFVRPRVAGDEAGGAPWVELESLLKPSAGFHSATLLHQYISQVDGHGEKLRSKFSGMPVVERCL